jgi:glycerate dehydrogenase
MEKLGEVIQFERTPQELVVERCLGAEVVLTNKVKVFKEAIDQLPDLKYIGVTATGTNVVDISYASEKEIQVTNVPGYSADSVAQHVIAMILHFSSQIASHNESVHKGDWVNSADFSYTLSPLHELSGKTLGVVGLGSIGRKAAAVASALGMNIVAAHQSSMNRLVLLYDVEWLPVDEVFKKADFLTLHCPLTDDTDKLVNKSRLETMKKTSVIINTGRGPLIDEPVLAEALNNNQIAGAALDVLSSEPPAKNNPLLSAKNCVITPHVAWASVEARKRLIDTVTSNICSFVEGNTQNLVN